MAFITAAKRKLMRADRAAGMKYREIAEKYGVGMETAFRHCDEKHAERQRKVERNRYWRTKADPVAYEAYKEKMRLRMRRYAEENRRARSV